MTTLSGVLEQLRVRKQDNEFIISEEGFKSPSGKLYLPDDLKIIMWLMKGPATRYKTGIWLRCILLHKN